MVQVYTWGNGVYGQLGQGAVLTNPIPSPVFGKGNCWRCCIIALRMMVCLDHCGRDMCGAALFDKAISIRSISCGTHHNFATSYDNVLYSWGSNKYGCLGAEIDVEYTAVPQRVRLLNAHWLRWHWHVLLVLHYTVLFSYTFDPVCRYGHLMS